MSCVLVDKGDIYNGPGYKLNYSSNSNHGIGTCLFLRGQDSAKIVAKIYFAMPTL